MLTFSVYNCAIFLMSLLWHLPGSFFTLVFLYFDSKHYFFNEMFRLGIRTSVCTPGSDLPAVSTVWFLLIILTSPGIKSKSIQILITLHFLAERRSVLSKHCREIFSLVFSPAHKTRLFNHHPSSQPPKLHTCVVTEFMELLESFNLTCAYCMAVRWIFN